MYEVDNQLLQSVIELQTCFTKKLFLSIFAHTCSVHFSFLITWLNGTGQVNINTGVEVREGTTVWCALTFQPQECMHSYIKEAGGTFESQRPD